MTTLKDVKLGGAADFRQFLDCQLRYYQAYIDKRDQLFMAKEKLVSSTQGLICHPETSSGFKRHLLRFIETI